MRQKTKTNNKSDLLKHIKRNHRIYYFYKYLLGWLIKRIQQFSFTPYKPKSDTFILISNHTTMLDPVYEAIAFKEYLRFVASDHLLRMGIWGKYIVHCVNPIPKRRGADSTHTMELMKESLKDGVNVCIHAEGFSSINGETSFVSARTGEMVKESGAGLITYHFIGGYFKDPRWAKYSRRGKFHGSVVNEYTPEDLKKMSVDEINEAIRRDIYVNAYDEQRKNPLKYKGKALAEDLETVLYICPKCKELGKLHSHNNVFECECGYKMTIDEYGFFNGDNLVFDNVLDWDKWQKKCIKENTELWKTFIDKPITVDKEQIFYCVEGDGEKELFSEHCIVSLFADRLFFEDEKSDKTITIMLSDIPKMSLGGAMKISFTAKNNYYEIQSHIRRSAVKYFALYRVLTGREYI